jgi:predicted dehydrogenase
MKVCFIGACGHSKQAYQYLKTRFDTEFVGMAPESLHEELTASFDPAIPFYTDYLAMLNEVRPDLAVVSPVFGHTGRAILACAERGIDVFAEKPVAATIEELNAVEAAVRESGIRFCAMHYLRYAPAFYHGAKLARSGAIGEVRMATAQKSYRYGKRPAWYHDRALYGGTIPWVGIHAIDWIYHFTGKRFLSVNTRVVGRDPEMAALCQFEMEDGVIGGMNLDFYRPNQATTHGDDRIRCVGTAGVLEVRGGEILLINGEGEQILRPTEAPELLEEFLGGGESVPPEEIFYLTRVAILARDAADRNEITRIEK